MYKIHYDGKPQTLLKTCKEPNVAWSMYVKKLKGRPEPIWVFHRFSDELLKEVYPQLGHSLDSGRVKSGKSRISDASQQENPIGCLSEFLGSMGRKIADVILNEAMEEKLKFRDE